MTNAYRTPRESCRAVRAGPGAAGNVASATAPLDEMRAQRIRHRLSPPGAAIQPLPRLRRDRMPTVIAHHNVTDKDHWLASPKREEVFGPLGVTNIRTFVDPQDPTRVALLMDVADMDVVMAAMDSDAMRDAMTHDGVVADSLVIVVEA